MPVDVFLEHRVYWLIEEKQSESYERLQRKWIECNKKFWLPYEALQLIYIYIIDRERIFFSLSVSSLSLSSYDKCN